jgi:hypothetical protein
MEKETENEVGAAESAVETEIEQVTKKKGRPKGSNSFIEVSLSDLNEILSPDQMVTVGKIWWFKQGESVTVSQLETKEVTIGENQEEFY